MRVVGLTGSIGMGKSTATRLLRQMRVPVYDADAAVHAVQARGGEALPAIAAAFPGSVKDGALDRAALGAQVFADPAALRRLEAIVHPLVQARQRAFLKRHAARRTPIVVLDIPLLFEGNGHRRVDATMVVSAPYFLQKRRVLARPGMTEAKFLDIVRRQVPDRIKRHGADFVIPSNAG
ncbi:MAG TPA: dephospho-CoA kinase, partial [Vineibacter sp.]|nr:dephospho-CoA kinase [Vineibacter sp.]